jgi:hypothetical protein
VPGAYFRVFFLIFARNLCVCKRFKNDESLGNILDRGQKITGF